MWGEYNAEAVTFDFIEEVSPQTEHIQPIRAFSIWASPAKRFAGRDDFHLRYSQRDALRFLAAVWLQCADPGNMSEHHSQ